MMVTASLLYSLLSLDVKTLAPSFSTWEIVFARGLVSFLLATLALTLTTGRTKQDFLGTRIRLLVVRGLLGGLNTSTAFLALTYLNLSVATVIISTGPILTGILRGPCCNDSRPLWPPFEYTKGAATLMCFAGVVTISSGGFLVPMDNFWLGVACALAAAVLSALVNVTIHEIREEKTLTITLYSMGACTLLALPGLCIVLTSSTSTSMSTSASEKTWTIYNLLRLGLTGVASFSAQCFKTRSLQMSEDLGVINLRYLEILFCILWDVAVLHSRLRATDVVGVALVLGGCVVHTIAGIVLIKKTPTTEQTSCESPPRPSEDKAPSLLI
jgi:S-adenosylmethionine uptake transporter